MGKKKYFLTARAGTGNEHTQEIEWTEIEYKKFCEGDVELNDEAQGYAIDLTGFEFYVKEE